MCLCMCQSRSIYDHAWNVNLHSCLGAQASLIRALHENANGRCFLAMKDREDSVARPSQHIWGSRVQK